MKFEEALVELRKGKKVKRVGWYFTNYMDLKNYNKFCFDTNEILNSTWELYEEPGKTFPEVFEAFKEGKGLKRKSWDSFMITKEIASYISSQDILENDWEVID